MPAAAVPLPLPPPVAAGWALFLDVDGCLVDFADDPAEVVAPPALVGSLLSLTGRLEGALALVSGRTIPVLDRMFAPARFPAAGLHGVERRFNGEDLETLQPGVPEALPALVDAAREALAGFPGALVEDKGTAVALHWRAAPAARPVVESFAGSALPRLPGYRLQPGDSVIELRPGGADKGTAIAEFLAREPFRGRLPVFAGDDLTDEHGFEVVNARGGISILVGARAGSAARCSLPDPAAVRAWLGAAA